MPQSHKQPTLARRALGQGLRRLREQLDWTIPQAAAAIGYSRQTITRIEQGEQPSRTQQVESLCKEYGAPDEQMMYLTALALASNERGWWEDHKAGVMVAFRLYAEAEQEARRIQVVEPEYIPGLLQTPDYIRQIQAIAPKPDAPETARAVLDFRVQRQDRLFGRQRLPEIHMIIGMQALGFLDSMPQVRDGQIARMLELAGRGVDIRIATQLHPAMGSMFTVLTPPDRDWPPFVYMDAMDGCRYVEDRDVVSGYQGAFTTALDLATPIERYLG